MGARLRPPRNALKGMPVYFDGRGGRNVENAFWNHEPAVRTDRMAGFGCEPDSGHTWDRPRLYLPEGAVAAPEEGATDVPMEQAGDPGADPGRPRGGVGGHGRSRVLQLVSGAVLPVPRPVTPGHDGREG